MQAHKDTSVSSSSVDVVALDDAVERIPTLIKMDIEGSELEALKGAARLVRDHKPRLAISVYHLPRDIPDIVNFIMSLNSDYRIGFRHHHRLFMDTVCYAY